MDLFFYNEFQNQSGHRRHDFIGILLNAAIEGHQDSQSLNSTPADTIVKCSPGAEAIHSSFSSGTPKTYKHILPGEPFCLPHLRNKAKGGDVLRVLLEKSFISIDVFVCSNPLTPPGEESVNCRFGL